MRVVVTGGAGFIGANLCRQLVDTTGVDSVTALDDLSTGIAENLTGVDGVKLVVGSILDSAVLDNVLAKTDAVVHLAARPSVPRSLADPMATFEVNVTGTVHLLEAIRRAGGPHLILASSSSVYGANPTLPKSEDLLPAPVSPYAASKLAGEAMTLSWACSFDLPVLVFRFFNVFGPLQTAGHAYAAAIPAFVSAAIAREQLTVHGDGKQTRDFTYVGSVAHLLADAVLRRVTSDGPVNLAFGGRASLLDVIGMIEAELGHPVRTAHVDPRPGDVRDSQADSSRLRFLFPGVEAAPLEHGLRSTIDWWRDRSKVGG